MKKIIIMAALAVCTTISMARCTNKQNVSEEKPTAGVVEQDEDLAPDFTLVSIDGTKLSLSQLRGKYVIIDFWGAWCYWCMKGVPQMKEYYGKYKDKLEILGVNYGDSEDKWKQTVRENDMPWKHVRTEDDAVCRLYKVEGFPTKVIIDPKGRLVKTVVGESEEFYTFLDNLFK